MARPNQDPLALRNYQHNGNPFPYANFLDKSPPQGTPRMIPVQQFAGLHHTSQIEWVLDHLLWSSDLQGHLDVLLDPRDLNQIAPIEDHTGTPGYWNVASGHHRNHWSGWCWFRLTPINAIVGRPLAHLYIAIRADVSAFEFYNVEAKKYLFKIEEEPEGGWRSAFDKIWKLYESSVKATVDHYVAEDLAIARFDNWSPQDLNDLKPAATVREVFATAMEALGAKIKKSLEKERLFEGPIDKFDNYKYLQFRRKFDYVHDHYWMRVLQDRKFDLVPRVDHPEYRYQVYGTPALLCYYVSIDAISVDIDLSDKIAKLFNDSHNFEVHKLDLKAKNIFTHSLAEVEAQAKAVFALILAAPNHNKAEWYNRIQLDAHIRALEISWLNLYRQLPDFRAMFHDLPSDESALAKTSPLFSSWLKDDGGKILGHIDTGKKWLPWWIIHELIKQVNVRQSEDFALQLVDTKYNREKGRGKNN